MAKKIEKEIVGYSVVDNGEEGQETATNEEPLERPDVVPGRTHKMKRPGNSIYVTINRDDEGNPIEVFTNSRDMDQAHVAVTRLISAMFRARIDPSLVVEELKAIKDPEGGYFEPGGGGYVPSTMAHLGKVLERELGKNKAPDPEPEPVSADSSDTDVSESEATDYKQCPECLEYAVIYSGGCPTCTSCGDSKCS